jgi:hypothetical protein
VILAGDEYSIKFVFAPQGEACSTRRKLGVAPWASNQGKTSMTAGDLAQFVGFFVAMTAIASCIGCLVDRGLIFLRTSREIDEDR